MALLTIVQQTIELQIPIVLSNAIYVKSPDGFLLDILNPNKLHNVQTMDLGTRADLQHFRLIHGKLTEI